MERLNLKQLRDLIDKLEEKKYEIERFSICADFCLEDPTGKIGLIYSDEEENWEKHLKMYDEEEYNLLKSRFIDNLNEDAINTALWKLDDYQAERLAEDYTDKVDWYEG